MRKQITHISIHQTSKVIAAMYAAIIAVIVAFPMALYTIFQGDILAGILMLILWPLVYWVVLYIGHVVGCWFYNLIAKRFGGIEFDIVDAETSYDHNQEPIAHSSQNDRL